MTHPRGFYILRMRLRSLFRRDQLEAELSEELNEHLESRTRQNIVQGMSLEDARFAALRSMHGLEQRKEECRDMRRTNFMEDAIHDVRFALRMLRKSPGFTAVVVLTLALGIGANTAIFSVVNAVLLRPLPYPDPSRIAIVELVGKGSHDLMPDMSVPSFAFLRDNTSRAFSSVAGFQGSGTYTLEQQKKLDWITAESVTDDFFQTLGVSPAIGRGFTRAETAPGAAPAVILTDALWRRDFNADPAVVGTQIKLEDRAFTVVGVLPRGFNFIENPVDAFMPLITGNNLGNSGYNTTVLARLQPGVNFVQAQTVLDQISPHAPRDESVVGMAAMGYQKSLVGDFRPALLILFGAVGLLLLIACANVASLILSRASSRAREISIRLAMGARRGRLLRQFLAESFVIALIGAIAGLLAAYWTLNSVVSTIPWELPSGAGSVTIDSYVLAFTLGAAVFTSVIFGFASFWKISALNLNEVLKEGGKQGAGGAARSGARNFLVVGEVALSLALLVGAALLGQTLYNLRSEKLGLDPKNLVTMVTPYPRIKPFTEARVWSYEQDMLARIQAVPGVASAAFVDHLPLDGWGNIPTQVPGLNDQRHSIGGMEIRAITPDYFATMRIPLVQGRAISEADSAGTQPVTVITQTVANKWWPSQNPIGQQILIGSYLGKNYIGGADPVRTVVGVVGDVRTGGMSEKFRPMVYIPEAQNNIQHGDTGAWVIRTAPKFEIGGALRQAVLAASPEQRILNLRPFSALISRSVAAESFNALLVGIFAGLGVALACVGIYGVLSLFVNQRTHEIGIRMALGANPRQVLWLVVGQGMILAAVGVAIGIAGSLGLTRFLKTLLYNVQPTNPASYVIGGTVLLLVALLASWIPARRATKVDPIIALRYE
jgi:putative ABC transport system permease protein